MQARLAPPAHLHVPAAAFRLEQLGRNGDLSHAAEALSRLEWETERLMPQLAQVGQEASK